MPSMSATATSVPSAAPIRSASLTSPIPIPAGYASTARKRKSEAPSAPSSHSRLGSQRGLRGEHDHGRRQHDAVRDDPVLEVDRRDRDEDDAEEGRDGGLEASGRTRARSPRRAARRRARRPGRARPIRVPQCRQRPRRTSERDERDVVVPGDRLRAATCRPSRGCTSERRERHARGDDVQEAADSASPGAEGEQGESRIHLALLSAASRSG